MRAVRRVSAAVALATVAMLALTASPALAAPSVTSYTVSPSTPNAGATGAGNDVNIHLELDGTSGDQQDVKDLIIHLPPGLVANPQAAPQCTEAELNADDCPAASQVGEVSNDVTAYIGVPPIVVPTPLTATGSLYNLVPKPGEPGRFGIVLDAVGGLQKIILQSGAKLRPGDFGLDSVLTDLPTEAGENPSIPIDINAVDLTLYGKAGRSHNQGNFVRLPTSCGTQTFGVDVTNYADETASGSASITTQNCAALPFDPKLTTKIGAPGQTGLGDRPPVSSLITQTIEEAGLSRAKVLLPTRVGADVNYLQLENYCDQAVFDNDPADCPPSSVVGNATAASPLLADPLTGTLTLINNPSGLPVLGLDLKGALHLKLFGQLLLDNTTGTLRGGVEFEVLPDIPISRFQLDFLRNRLNKLGQDACTPPPLTFDAQFNSFASQSKHSTPDATIVGCDSSGGGNKKPTAKLTLGGSGGKPTAALRIKAGSAKVRRVSLKPPAKLKLASIRRIRETSAAKANGKKLKPSKISKSGRSVSVKVGSAKRAGLRLGRGALKAAHSQRGKLAFKIVITDVKGKTTRLTKKVG